MAGLAQIVSSLLHVNSLLQLGHSPCIFYLCAGERRLIDIAAHDLYLPKAKLSVDSVSWCDVALACLVFRCSTGDGLSSRHSRTASAQHVPAAVLGHPRHTPVPYPH